MRTKGSKLQNVTLIASASDHLSTESLLKMKKELFHAAVKSEQVWPYIVLQGWGHRRRRGSAFSVRVVKYWNKVPDSIVTAPSVNVFMKKLKKVWTEVFSHLQH